MKATFKIFKGQDQKWYWHLKEISTGLIYVMAEASISLCCVLLRYGKFRSVLGMQH